MEKQSSTAVEKLLSQAEFLSGNAVKSARNIPYASLDGKTLVGRGPRDRVSLFQIAAGITLATPILTRHALGLSPYTALALSFLFVLTAGWSFYKSAAQNLIWKGIDTDAFISFSLLAAFALGAAPVAFPRFIPSRAQGEGMDFLCALAVFSTFGLWLADAMDSVGLSSLIRLSRLPPMTARVLDAKGEKTLPVAEVPAGVIVHARPGDQIPVDGVVASGSSLVDETIIRGPGRPLEKSEGAFVSAGAVNKSDSLWVRTQKSGSESQLSLIAQQAPSKNIGGIRLFGFADNAAALSLPLALIAALTMAVIWSIDGPAPRPVWACVVLFSILSAACPCALALAEPLAAWFGLRQSRKEGIGFLRLGALTQLRRVDVVLVGKSGVLSLGKPSVVKTVALRSGAEKKALAAALAVAERSFHPLAQAVAACARDAGAKPLAIESFDIEEGRGLAAKINGKIARLGSLSWLKACGISIPSSIEANGDLSILGFSWGEEALLAFIMQDEFRKDAALAVTRMKKIGIETVLVCGDRNESAYRAAEQAGIGRVFAEALPDEKMRLIERLKAEGKRVAFLGRKFSDAPALCRADISFSTQSASPVSQDVADIILEDGSISQVARAFALGDIIRKTARKNVLWALGVNIILIPAAAGVLYPHFKLLVPNLLLAAVVIAQIAILTINSQNTTKEKPQ